MKTIIKSLVAFSILITTAITSDAQVRIFVRTRPVEPVIVRPAAPYRGAVWIPGEWQWRGGRYVYVNPHYVHARRGHVWTQGHWNNISGGSVWVAGRWR
jgi:hypothetical protein